MAEMDLHSHCTSRLGKDVQRCVTSHGRPRYGIEVSK